VRGSSAKGGELYLWLDSSLEPTTYTNTSTLPEACFAEPDASPNGVFMAMWAAMDENYAFFDLHGVDWDARRSLAPEVGQNMTDQELFDVFVAALEGLDDGHVQLIADPIGYHSPSVAPAWTVGRDFSRDGLNQTARDAIGTPLTTFENADLEYGLRDDGIGYVLITGMSTDPSFGEMDSTLSREVFAQIARDLAGARGIIVDVRYNPGGNDGTAFAYAGHFTHTAREVLSKRARDGDGWTPWFNATLTPAPSEVYLGQPVVLLTSRLTGSGAEIFTMAMRDLPQVTVMGENTGGGLSDILGVSLPNGWKFGLSNQEYATSDGSIYEATGIPPEIVITIDPDALARGEDPVLQAAISKLLNSGN
jgi:hypothetical protein